MRKRLKPEMHLRSPWSKMIVGDSFLVPASGDDGRRIRWAASQASWRLSPRKFSVRQEHHRDGRLIGYRCRRVK